MGPLLLRILFPLSIIFTAENVPELLSNKSTDDEAIKKSPFLSLKKDPTVFPAIELKFA
jgi:hypothetical protein